MLEGVFERYPKLKMVMIEAGFGWAPSLGWRLDKNFERLHSEVPHLKRKPSEYIRDHIWWTTQPMEDPERRDHLFQVIEWIGWDKLLFATDYPHWDFDEPSRVLPAGVSDANREAFYLGNAKKLYGIELMARHVIAPVEELPPGTRKFLTIDERPIAIFNIKGEFFGLLNRCPHQGAALCEGPLIGLATILRSRRDRIHQTRRDHPLPLARLGIRHPHRAILLRPQALSRPRLSGQCRAGIERGEGAVCGGDARRLGRERLRRGGFVVGRRCEIRRVGKGASALCPPSITDRAS